MNPSLDTTTDTTETDSAIGALKLLLYTDRGNALLALGGMYTLSMSLSFTLLYTLFRPIVTVGSIVAYTVFLVVFIWFRAPDRGTRRISYVLYIVIPYVFTVIGIGLYETTL